MRILVFKYSVYLVFKYFEKNDIRTVARVSDVVLLVKIELI